jgi:mono/diheme cytochrome c family protein
LLVVCHSFAVRLLFNRAPQLEVCVLKRRIWKKQMSKQGTLKKTSLLFLALLIFVCASWAQGHPPDNKIPPEEAAKVNPVKPSSESLAKGKKLYGYDCAMCHGASGDGKGDMATDMKNVPDFTKPGALKDRPDGELFYVVRNGKGEMPPEGDRAKDDDIWNMVNYVRSLAQK